MDSRCTELIIVIIKLKVKKLLARKSASCQVPKPQRFVPVLSLGVQINISLSQGAF